MSLQRDVSPYQGLLVRLRELAGLHISLEGHIDIAAATDRAMQRTGIDRVETYVAEIEAGRVSLTTLIEEVTVGETYFFREPDQFAFMRDVVFPSLVEGGAAERPIRIWSAGCASGEEPYSLAILMTELGLEARASILATDISNKALTKAVAANYGAWSLRSNDAYRAQRFLTATGKVLHLDEQIRRLVSFRTLNLAKDVYPFEQPNMGGFNLIVCRNVLIYLDGETVARVARSFFDSLAEGGWLILASSDPPLAGLAPFESVVTERGIFYRRITKVAGQDGTATSRQKGSPAANVGGASAGRRVVPKLGRTLLCETRIAKIEPLPLAVTKSSVASSVRSFANAGDIAGAKAVALAAIQEEPLDAEAHYLLAAVLIDLRCDVEAIAVLRRALYLDSKFIVAHLALALALDRIGESEPARRALRTVRRLCAALPKTAAPPGPDGESAAYFATIAEGEEARLARVAPQRGSRPLS